MPKLQLVGVVDATCKDVKFPAENIIGRAINRKWLCKKGEMNLMMTATFRLAKPSLIKSIDIGNAGSASITLLVSRSGTATQEFRELIPSTQLRSEKECRNDENKTGVKMFVCRDLREDTRHEKWDLLCVVCCQPYRRSEDEQFGLTFLTVQEATEQSPGLSSMEKMRECAQRSSFPAKKEVSFANTLSRAERMILATKSQPTSPDHGVKSVDDLFKATVISFLDANANVINSKSAFLAKTDLLSQLEQIMNRKFNTYENRIFMQLFRSYATSEKDKLPSGILTPRTSNRQILASPSSRKMEDTKISLLKPQLNDSFTAYNTQTVYFAEVVHNHAMKDGPVSYLGRSGKENSPYLLERHGLTNGDTAIDETCPPVANSERKMCLENTTQEKLSPRDSWKKRNDLDQCDSRDCSPETWLKRKSDPSERSQPANKKRPRENASSVDKGSESKSVNRIIPSGGWLLNNTGFHKKNLSPPEVKKQDTLKFPFRVSPPPPLDRPASPLPLVDDIDQPSTSSRETVAERNIRLEMERRLAERSPPERVVQRTSSGKVKGTFCTKGMNTNDSPMGRLSICDENDEIGSPQARRKLSFVRQNRQDGDADCQVECPICKSFFDSGAINKHLDDCVPSPIKKPDDGENDDEMACPICGLWQPKDTVAAHADECAQKRYGA